MRVRWAVAALVLFVTALAAVAPAAAQSAPPPDPASYPAPEVTLPPPGVHGYALWDSYFDLAPFGYEEQEYFVSGTATSDGGASAPYRTRIIVARPSDPARFNGAVLLDWVNVTAQFENAVDTMLAREMLLREGFAYVHVSAQAAGLCCIPLTPEVWDPLRYGSLQHPGDPYANDIFTQVAQAFSSPAPGPGSIDPAGPLAGHVERVLAAGQSQSANRLATYVEQWLPSHPAAVGIIDGVLVHGNVPGVKSFAAASPIPVLQLLSDFEARNDGVDPSTVGPNYRLWEIAGTSHADHFIGYQSVFGHGPRVLLGAGKVDPAGFRRILDAAGTYGEVVSPLLAVCVVAGAAMPMRYAASSALHQLDDWVAGGPAPANGPRFTFGAGGALAKDQYGNTQGGVRLPPIDVPVARYVSTLCALGGITVPFTDPELRSTYGSFETYRSQLAAKADEAVAGGWLLPEDAVDLLRRACGIRARFGEAAAECPPYVPPPYRSVSPSVTTSPSATSGDIAMDAGQPALPTTGGAPDLSPLVLMGLLAALVQIMKARLARTC